MGFKRRRVALVLGGTLLFSCQCQIVDHEARTYFRDGLAPFLDSLTYQLCQIKYQVATTASGRLICPAPGVASPKAPRNGDPGDPSGKKDSEVRAYIRYKLEPYLDSLAYQLCHVKSRAAPTARGRIVCPGPPEGYKKPPGNGAP
jgi:hypothetical protein